MVLLYLLCDLILYFLLLIHFHVLLIILSFYLINSNFYALLIIQFFTLFCSLFCLACNKFIFCLYGRFDIYVLYKINYKYGKKVKLQTWPQDKSSTR